MHLLKTFFYTICLLTLSSCFKKEDAVKLPIGNSEITTLFLGKDYEYDMYFDMSSNSYKQNKRSEWDLRFESSDDGWGVFINTEAEIVVHKLDLYHLSEPTNFDTNAIIASTGLIDKPSGLPEESAMWEWKDSYKQGGGATQLHGIYVLEFKRRSMPHKLKRMQIISVSDTTFECIFTDFYDAAGDSILYNNNRTIIKKDKNQNYTYFSFEGGVPHVVPNVEPNKDNWDFVFTRYIEFFNLSGSYVLPYPVNGVKSNRNNVLVARDSLTNFNDINASTIGNYTFSSRADAIGYDWKSHAYSGGGTYTVNSKITYIIKDTDGDYYKLRFLDFYNEKAEKGYPKFEFVRIK